MKNSKIASIIISAGYSSRMGEFKPYLKFGEKSAIEKVVDTHKKAGIKDITVVTGFRGSEVTEKLKNAGVRCVQNENYDKGMFTSVVEGVKAMDSGVSAFFMQPVDIPLIKSFTIQTLIKKFQDSESGIIYPEFDGKAGHPPLIDIRYKEEILKSSGEGGLKGVLEEHSCDSMHVPVYDKAILMDMDTKEDYAKLLRYFKNTAPNSGECYSILNKYKVPENIIKHSRKVSLLCFKIIYDLQNTGCDINGHALGAAAMLHDMAKREKDHAKAGEMILKEIGYEKVGSIIGSHNDIEVNENADITENEILFLADKLVKEDKIVSIEERFREPLAKFSDKPDVLDNIMKRRDAAYKIVNKIEKITGNGFLWTE